MLITIFTPLYNRASHLNTIWHSLVTQSDINIEWLIIDDGSTDFPEKIIQSIIEKSNFNVSYYKKENRGKHTAINYGLDKAKGDYFLMLDSDDELPENALVILRKNINKIHNNAYFAGVAGRKMNKNKILVGNSFNGTIESNSLDIRYKHAVIGDLTEVFKTKIFKNYKFPEIENEKFCPEVLVWNRIAKDYKLLFFNEPIYICEYLEDGLSDQIVKIRMTSPIASMLTYSELASYNIPIIQKIKAFINFWRFAFNSKITLSKKLIYLHTIMGILLLPLGYAMYLKDVWKNK